MSFKLLLEPSPLLGPEVDNALVVCAIILGIATSPHVTLHAVDRICSVLIAGGIDHREGTMHIDPVRIHDSIFALGNTGIILAAVLDSLNTILPGAVVAYSDLTNALGFPLKHPAEV